MTASAFVTAPPQWPHVHLRPRSEAEATALMTVAPDRVVFVFGSNQAGRHIGGAAKHARDHFGAEMGHGVGWFGSSYAIPTMDRQLRTLPPHQICPGVAQFLRTAAAEPAFTFYVTAIGTGIAGLPHGQMAPMFADRSVNCLLPPEWLALLSTSSSPGVLK